MVVEAFSIGNDLLAEKDDLFCTCTARIDSNDEGVLPGSCSSPVSFRSVHRGRRKEARIRYRVRIATGNVQKLASTGEK